MIGTESSTNRNSGASNFGAEMSLGQETSLGPPQASIAPVDEDGLATFEQELHALSTAAAAAHLQRSMRDSERVVEGFKAEAHAWSHTLSCADGALWARGDAEECLFKGYVQCPGVRANALFDALLQPEALKTLFPSSLSALKRVLTPTDGSAADQPEDSNELWRLVLNLPFSRHAREFSAWRVARRHPHDGEYVLAIRNGPLTEESGRRRGHGIWSRRARPGFLIGYNGLIVTDLDRARESA